MPKRSRASEDSAIASAATTTLSRCHRFPHQKRLKPISLAVCEGCPPSSRGFPGQHYGMAMDAPIELPRTDDFVYVTRVMMAYHGYRSGFVRTKAVRTASPKKLAAIEKAMLRTSVHAPNFARGYDTWRRDAFAWCPKCEQSAYSINADTLCSHLETPQDVDIQRCGVCFGLVEPKACDNDPTCHRCGRGMCHVCDEQGYTCVCVCVYPERLSATEFGLEHKATSERLGSLPGAGDDDKQQ